MLILNVIINQVREHVTLLLLLLNLHQLDPEHLKHEQMLKTKLLNKLPVGTITYSLLQQRLKLNATDLL